MPITISGSTGIAGVDGSASTPAVQGTDTNTGIVFPAADTVAVATGGTERMRVDSSGNVGIGTSSPGAKLDVSSSIRATGSGSSFAAINGGTSDGANIQLCRGGSATQNAYLAQYQGSLFLKNLDSGSIIFTSSTSDTERMRIDTSGNLLVGKTTTASDITTVGAFIQNNGKGVFTTTGVVQPLVCAKNASTTGALIDFYYNGSSVGSISTTGTATAYNTSSDYRLKHDVQPLTSGLAIIASLKPTTYKWNADNSYGEGFIAHELQAVIPQAVTGEKDAVNDDGSIKSQGVDYSKIVVHLVAAIQELKADNDAMKERIATLEAK